MIQYYKKFKENLTKESLNLKLLSPEYSPNPYYIDFGWLSHDKITLPDKNTIWKGTNNLKNDGVTLTWENKQNITFKRIIKNEDNYLLKITEEVYNNSEQPIEIYSYNLISRTNYKPNDTVLTYEGPLGYFNKKLHEEPYDDLKNKGKAEYLAKGGWIGITDKYWFTSIIPEQDKNLQIGFRYLKMENNINKYQIDTLGPPQILNPGLKLKIVSHIFVGAKIVSLLDKYEELLEIPRFDLATDFGWFHFIAKPLFYILQCFNDTLGSFALAILLLTVIVKILFFPLTNRSYKAMAKLKLLSPQLEILKKDHENDKIKMQQEMMALYRKANVNPASGCLPMLLQLPIFFALYKVLMVSIEMRHEPFYGWINDLSAPDPLNLFNLFGLIPWTPPEMLHVGIWPIIMGITMLIQQKLSPPPSDPMQAKIFMLMPIVFVFLFANFPAGLVIYWAWSNILSLIQQWFIIKTTPLKK